MSFIEKKIARMLEEQGVKYELLEHEPVYTSEQAAKVRGVSLRTGVKALVCKTSENKIILVLVRADKRADLDRVAKMEGAKRVSLASPEEVLKHTGCEIGSVPPFGHRKALKTYLDREILEQDEVNFNIGEHTKSIRMRARDLLRVMEPVLF
jgi:Ala-tRNA(Pro) deacylase